MNLLIVKSIKLSVLIAILSVIVFYLTPFDTNYFISSLTNVVNLAGLKVLLLTTSSRLQVNDTSSKEYINKKDGNFDTISKSNSVNNIDEPTESSTIISNNEPKHVGDVNDEIKNEKQFVDNVVKSKQDDIDTKNENIPKNHPIDTGSFLTSLKSIKLNDIVPLLTPLKPITIGDLDIYNNIHIYPRLSSIINMPYFRFVKLNLAKECTLWPDDQGKCSERNCKIQFCKEGDLPLDILLDDANGNSQQQQQQQHLTSKFKKTSDKSSKTDDEKSLTTNQTDDYLDCQEQEKLSQINNTISIEHEQSMDSLFECTYDEDGQYIDLLLNPERYTGYSGSSAHRIWRSIYEENCFFNHPTANQLISKNAFSLLDNLCYEERIFYRAISGLHTSINIHLCSYFPQKVLGPSTSALDDSQKFTFNLQEFTRRFKGRTNYLTNLYFVYLLELRALAKVEKYLINYVNWQSMDDAETSIATTRDAIKSLLKVIKKSPASFNETQLFNSISNNFDFSLPSIASEFAGHFKNITSNIMDCVACDKCKLWGKIQTHGLSTAFKILTTHESIIAASVINQIASSKDASFSDSKHVEHYSTSQSTQMLNRNRSRFHLTRHEITCLINGIAKLSHSIHFLGEFDKLFNQKHSPGIGNSGNKSPFVNEKLFI